MSRNSSRYYQVVCLTLGLLSSSSVFSLNSVTLSIKEIVADDWVVQDAKLSIFGFNKKHPQFSLLSAALVLPPPFENISALDISCQQFNWHDSYLNCTQGQGHFKSEGLLPISFDFSLKVENEKATIRIQKLVLFGGELNLYVHETVGKWQFKIQAKNLKLAKLKLFFNLPELDAFQGVANIDINLNGKGANINDLLVSAVISELTVQTRQGNIATENISLNILLQAHKKNSSWAWSHTSEALTGGLYIDPIYLDAQATPLTLIANGIWQPEKQALYIERVQLEHLSAGLLQGAVRLNYQDGLMVETADFFVSIPQLQSAAPIYLSPFLETGVFEGIHLAGRVDAVLAVNKNAVTNVSVDFRNLLLDDAQKQFYIKDAYGQINWADQANNRRASIINWKKLAIKAIPFEQGLLEFTVFGKQLSLLKQANLAMLGGILSIKQFSFAAVANDDAQVYFEGSVNRLSLEQLSTALNWTALSGEISGYIPSVHYQNKKLELDGELKIQIFNGEITIKKLASSGMFSDFSQFYTDIEIDNLDLHALTRKFQVGNIEGRLSGFARDVYLENWQPVSFYAWLGTPDNDDSRHKVSQKAVENIASIGGGGAADIISRSFLGLFNNFGYDKLGFGCYLHQGVCQIMALEAVGEGFYIIKGGGLPQINVIGYNPRVNWDVLVQRLKRVTSSNELIVE